jgi:hypothetical protein
MNSAADFFLTFWRDAKIIPASRSITADVLVFGLAAIILMVTEGRKHNVRFVWAYVAGGFLVAISVAFPLFLIARELRMGAYPERKTRVFLVGGEHVCRHAADLSDRRPTRRCRCSAE